MTVDRNNGHVVIQPSVYFHDGIQMVYNVADVFVQFIPFALGTIIVTL